MTGMTGKQRVYSRWERIARESGSQHSPQNCFFVAEEGSGIGCELMIFYVWQEPGTGAMLDQFGRLEDISWHEFTARWRLVFAEDSLHQAWLYRLSASQAAAFMDDQLCHGFIFVRCSPKLFWRGQVLQALSGREHFQLDWWRDRKRALRSVAWFLPSSMGAVLAGFGDPGLPSM